MSGGRAKCVAAVAVLVGCGLLAKASGPGDAAVDFSKGYPAAGGKAKEVSCAVEWTNCTGAATVEIVLYKTVNNLPVNCGETSTNVTLANGTWATTIGNIPTGTVVTSADVTVKDAQGKGIAAKGKADFTVTVP